MEYDPTPETAPVQNRSFPWSTLIVSIVIVVIAVISYLAFLKVGKATIQTVDTVIRVLPDAAEKFKTGTITQTFVERIPEVNSTNGDVLELATSRSEETFTKSSSMSIAYDWIYLGTTVSEIRVPATFRYHLRLSDPWRLAAKEKVCYVLAPPVRPSLPTAIHTDQMQKSTTNGWARFDKGENLAELERSITPELDRRAGDKRHIKLAREACRQSVAEFVKKWLMREEFWRSDRFSSIVVVFADEKSITSDEELEQFNYEPTVKLE